MGSTTYEILPSYTKLVDVVLCVLHAGERLGTEVTQFDVVKSAFLADVEMLETYGIPITFDVYKAMKHGPVGSALLGLLHEDPGVIAKTGPVQWTRSGPLYGSSAFHYSSPRRPVDADVLNPAQIGAIGRAFERVKSEGFERISAATHGHPAFDAAWRTRDRNTYPVMDYALMLRGCTPRQLEDLAYLSSLDHDG